MRLVLLSSEAAYDAVCCSRSLALLLLGVGLERRSRDC